MWMMAVSLAVGGLAILVFASRKWRTMHRGDLGWMSQQWLAENRSGHGGYGG